jgi:hypothetical protein
MEEWTVIVQALDRAEDYIAVRTGKASRVGSLLRLRKAIPLALRGRDALANETAA